MFASAIKKVQYYPYKNYSDQLILTVCLIQARERNLSNRNFESAWSCEY